MPVPNINEADISAILPQLKNVQYLKQGGQKIVFSCEIDGKPYVVKFLLIERTNQAADQGEGDMTIPALDAVTARARREVDTMANVDVPTLVKLGPIGLSTTEIKDQLLLYFTEEKIEGRSLHDILGLETILPCRDVVRLGLDIALAIEAIWDLRRIHRDIKPNNIIRRTSDERFILLDVGLVFDLQDISLTAPHVIVGTKMYLSPDQMQYDRKRQLDFRSDLFALGIVMYESATGQHPFAEGALSTQEIFARILNVNPIPPTQIRSEIPFELEEIILRLLRKSPHLRYRNCQQLIQQLQGVPIS
jgi:serine/threonine protein kinase